MPLCGGVSRPSMKQWTKTRSTLFFARHAQQREEMLHVRMHAAVAQQAQQMQVARAAALHGVEQQRLLEKFAVGDQSGRCA